MLRAVCISSSIIISNHITILNYFKLHPDQFSCKSEVFKAGTKYLYLGGDHVTGTGLGTFDVQYQSKVWRHIV